MTVRLGSGKGGAAAEETSNPYLAGKREWVDRHGPAEASRRNWQIIALLMVMTNAGFAAGTIYLSRRISNVAPFVAVVNGATAETITSGIAEPRSDVAERVKRAAMATWIQNVRMVTVDGNVQAKAVWAAYDRIAGHSKAERMISHWYQSNPPAKRALTGTVTAEVATVLETSDRTYQVDWIETTRDTSGNDTGARRFRASLTAVEKPPSDEEEARKNPLGLWITDVSWSPVATAGAEADK